MLLNREKKKKDKDKDDKEGKEGKAEDKEDDEESVGDEQWGCMVTAVVQTGNDVHCWCTLR